MVGFLKPIVHQPSALIWRLMCGATLWWILTEGSTSSWLIGVPSVIISVLISFQLSPAGQYRIHFLALPSFMLFFLLTSLVAGFDIARRTLKPTLAVGSQWVMFETSLKGLPRWLFMSSLSLMPGTLSVNSEEKGLLIHSLDDSETTLTALKKLENKIIRLFVQREAG